MKAKSGHDLRNFFADFLPRLLAAEGHAEAFVAAKVVELRITVTASGAELHQPRAVATCVLCFLQRLRGGHAPSECAGGVRVFWTRGRERAHRPELRACVPAHPTMREIIRKQASIGLTATTILPFAVSFRYILGQGRGGRTS